MKKRISEHFGKLTTVTQPVWGTHRGKKNKHWNTKADVEKFKMSPVNGKSIWDQTFQPTQHHPVNAEKYIFHCCPFPIITSLQAYLHEVYSAETGN